MNSPTSGTVGFESDTRAWDVVLSLADLTFFFNAVVDRNEGRPPPSLTAPLPPPYVRQTAPYTVTQGEIRWWWESVSNIHRVADALIAACEEVVEAHIDDSRFAALKTALAHAQGYNEYYPRHERP